MDSRSVVFLCLAIAAVCLLLGWIAAKKIHLPRWLDTPLDAHGLGNGDVTTGEELLEQLDEVESEEIADDQKEMIANIVELDDVTAGDIMTHRTEFSAMPAATLCRDAVKLAIESGHSRLPVYDRDVDHIVGILYIKDLLVMFDNPDRQNDTVDHLVRPAPFVPESCPARQLLKDFKTSHTQLAVVVDEYGGTAGLVSMEDVLEEIVGDIQDEYDNETEEIQQTADGFVCDGTTRLEDVFDAFGLPLPEKTEEEESDTAGGLIIDRLGRIPDPGEQAGTDWGGLHFAVQEAAPRHIARVKVTREG